jgi:aminoglycoside phosphotransferase (APT) family kinase protein
MALINTLDPAAATTALQDWLAERLTDARDVAVTDLQIPQSAGMSMTTILFAARWTGPNGDQSQDFVARVAPQGPGVFKTPDLSKEYRLLKALHTTSVPAPEAYWLEEDPSVLGAPFMVVERVEGRVPGDDPPYTVEGFAMDLAPADRGKLFEECLQIFAKIHALDWRALGLEDVLDEPQFGPTGVRQQIAHWEDVYDWASADSVRSPTVDAGLAWVKANCPADEKLVLNWGDGRPGNIIYGDDVSARAALDWEMALIGSPQSDVGWLAFMIRYFSDGIGVPNPEGMPDREQMIARYAELTGNAVDHVDFYEAFSALKLAILYLRVGSLMIAAGKLPADSAIAVNNPPAAVLAKLIGAPPPSGATANYVGARG